MSSETRHRGAHPGDQDAFGPEALEPLRLAVSDLCWLLGKGYARVSALKLVGDRHALTERQRLAVGRAACGEASQQRRAAHQFTTDQMRDAAVAVDGFNLLVTLEAALSGGVVLRCRDGCVRDMSSVHGSYHAVVETSAAIEVAAQRLAALQVRSVRWLLDSPVSNSGRLAQRLREVAEAYQWPWTVETVFNPDHDLVASTEVVISSDAAVLERANAWFNLAADLLDTGLCQPSWVVDLRT